MVVLKDVGISKSLLSKIMSRYLACMGQNNEGGLFEESFDHHYSTPVKRKRFLGKNGCFFGQY